MSVFAFGRPSQWIVLVAAASLVACAPAPTHSHAPQAQALQPLQRIEVAGNPEQRALLTHLLAGELALADTQVEAAAQHYAEAARISDDPAIAEQATHIAIASRQWDLARTTLARWQTLQGEDAGLHQARAMLALHDEHADAAYADFAWLARQPDGSGWRAVSQALLTAQDKLIAGAMLARLLHDEAPAASGSGSRTAMNYADLGSKPETFIAVGQLAMRLQRRDLAQALAAEAVTRFHSPDAYAFAAQLKLSEGDKDGARKLFADALQREKSGNSPRETARRRDLRVAYASLLGDLGDNVEAAKALAQGPQNDFTYTARAAYLARGPDKPDQTLVDALYREVLGDTSPRSGARTQLLGQLAELRERKADALAWYAQVPEDDAEHWFGAQMRTAVLLNDTGKSADALNLLHALQARTGDDGKALGETFLLEAELLGKQKRGDEALAVYDRGLLALPDDTRLIYARALLNEDLDHVDAAIHDLRRVLELKPDDADAMNALGYTLADHTEKGGTERIREALTLIENALKLRPGEPAIIDSLGWVQYRLGNLDEAAKQLRIAYAKQPDPEIAAHLGEVLWVAGQKDEAKRIWAQGRAKDNANKVLVETIKRLSS